MQAKMQYIRYKSSLAQEQPHLELHGRLPHIRVSGCELQPRCSLRTNASIKLLDAVSGRCPQSFQSECVRCQLTITKEKFSACSPTHITITTSSSMS